MLAEARALRSHGRPLARTCACSALASGPGALASQAAVGLAHASPARRYPAGSGLFEKQISGLYLGEVARRILLR